MVPSAILRNLLPLILLFIPGYDLLKCPFHVAIGNQKLGSLRNAESGAHCGAGLGRAAHLLTFHRAEPLDHRRCGCRAGFRVGLHAEFRHLVLQHVGHIALRSAFAKPDPFCPAQVELVVRIGGNGIRAKQMDRKRRADWCEYHFRSLVVFVS